MTVRPPIRRPSTLHFSAAARALRPVPAAVLALAATLAAGAAHPAAGQQSTAADDELARGRMHYIASCARCHGVNGGGGEGPPLARATLTRAPDDPSLLALIQQGIPGTAMTSARWLSDEEARLVASYVRSLAPTGGGTVALSPEAIERGRRLYERGRCASCHTVGGFGTGRGPDLTAVGARRGPDYLREAVIDPAAALPRGLTVMPRDFLDYLPVRVVDADGREVRGMRMNEDSYTIQIKDTRGTVHSFYKPALRELEKQYDRSLMRSYRDDFSAGEVDDLVSYLMSLTGAARLVS